MTESTRYSVLRAPRYEMLPLRGLDIHLTRWGPPQGEAPPVFLLHGWQDTGATFQFMVDALRADWSLVALDWRGFGRSGWARDGYWFADYLADLDALLDVLSPGVPARLIGHSMGGNIATLYAGLRPTRVRCVASLEGFGSRRVLPEEAPAQLRRWLDQVVAPPASKNYESFEQLAAVVAFRYPRFSATQADFVARMWGRPDTQGRIHLLGDPRHRWVSPVPFKREDAAAVWREVTAPVLLLSGMESDYLSRLGEAGTESTLRAAFPQVDIARVAGAGHMLHIEQAATVAALLENFLSIH